MKSQQGGDRVFAYSGRRSVQPSRSAHVRAAGQTGRRAVAAHIRTRVNRSTAFPRGSLALAGASLALAVTVAP
ncbi:hypothetical protein ACIQ1J_06540 [Streptomyces sp. NPDC097107]|uniref:hypothetical protein n=1 Tax=Streptomyces sp. NPDC097107 TaxID=3366089 RepID=UPI00381FC709